ncbi:DUF6928 family protein [Calidifontibacter terrae]
MGAKDWIICFAETDAAKALSEVGDLDLLATETLVRALFPGREPTRIGDGTLGDNLNPADNDVYAGVWPGVALVCTSEVAVDRPSELHPRFLVAGKGRVIHLHAMHSAADWCAFGVWDRDGRLVRAMSISGGDEEIHENTGEPLAAERPFWAGDFPASEDAEEAAEYPFAFHPLDLGEAVLEELFGFVLEGPGSDTPDAVDPYAVRLAGFRLS